MTSLPFRDWARPTIRYCESNLNGWIAQPANAGSSLLISLAGVYILTAKRHAYSLYLGVIAIILGLASFFYYASFTFVGQLADLGSMYMLAALLIVVALRRSMLSRNQKLSIIAVGTGLPLIVTAVLKTIDNFNIGIPFFAILLFTAVYLELKAAAIEKLNLRFFGLTSVAFAIGYIFWWLDYKKLWCNTGSYHYINGHAVWHLLNSVALVCLDRYYSQIRIPRKRNLTSRRFDY